MAEFIGGLIVGLCFALQIYLGQRRILKIKDEHIKDLQKDNNFWLQYSKNMEEKYLNK